MSQRTFDIAVVGAGPVGLAAALAIAELGYSLVLIAPKPPGTDKRTSALLGGSIDFLDGLGVWSGIREQTAPLRVMRIIDGTQRLIRSPEVAFDASEIDRFAFGYNVPNVPLVAALDEALAATDAARIEDVVTNATLDATGIVLQTESHGEVRAGLVVAADGRKSRLREIAGIGVRSWDYDQTALVCNLDHSHGHDDTSTEFHTENGPFTLVPLPGRRSSLVWLDTPDETRRRLALSREALAREIEERSHHLLGTCEISLGPQSFPMSGMSVDRFAARRIALAGESAHVFPPIGAQGLNLGYRDVSGLVRVLAEGSRGDPGDAANLAAYDRDRRADVWMRTNMVDALNRTLLADFLPAQGLRGLGLFALDRIAPLRRFAMRAGLGGERISADPSETDRAAGSG